MDVVDVGLYDGDGLFVFEFYALESHFIFGVEMGIEGVGLELLQIECGDLEVSVEAFGNAAHFGVAVPVELFIGRDNHKKEGEVAGLVDGEGDDGVGDLQLAEELVDFRDLEFVDIACEQLQIVVGDKRLSAQVDVFLCDIEDALEERFDEGVGGQHLLKLHKLLAFTHFPTWLLNTRQITIKIKKNVTIFKGRGRA